ncbi:unnamed protein product [Linum trigynum]|uniref:Uncharacterized protein n=1 Tax=Linum trigynum TaxID=586398 RepID=A0AAV2ERJ7_9ROSI
MRRPRNPKPSRLESSPKAAGVQAKIMELSRRLRLIMEEDSDNDMGVPSLPRDHGTPHCPPGDLVPLTSLEKAGKGLAPMLGGFGDG